MSDYDMIIIDEVSQLSKYTFERLLRLWHACGKSATLAFAGDFSQLKGVEPTQALDSVLWAT
eukprot:4229783-Prorocentrum_lima.AAC.1